MISEGAVIKIRPYKRYKDEPEKNEDIGVGSDYLGDYQQFQVMDRTFVKGEKQPKMGWLYVRAHTNVLLAPNDLITVKKIEYIIKKGNSVVIAIKIDETSPFNTGEEFENQDEMEFKF